MINQNKNQRIYLFYIFCHQENACPHQPNFLLFPLHLMLLDFHWLKNSKDLWNALIQSFESREHINVKVYPHFEFKFIMQHVHTFHAYLVQSLLRNAVWMLWSLCDFKCNANLTKSRYYESVALLNKNSWPNWQCICRFTIGPCIYSHFLTLIINFLFWPIRKSVLNRNT